MTTQIDNHLCDDSGQGVGKLLAAARELSVAGKYRESNRLYFRLLKGNSESKDLHILYLAIADNYMSLGCPRKARHWAARCLELRKAPNWLACAHARVAAAESRLSNSSRQLEHSLAALRMFNSENEHYDCDQERSACRTAASVYYDRGDVAMAASLLENALQAPSSEPWVPRERVLLGDCFRALGDHQKAVSNYSAALQARQPGLDGVGRALARWGTAAAMLMLGMRREAWESYYEALKEASAASLRFDITRRMARWLATLGDVDAAVRICLQCARDAPNNRQRAWFYLQVAQIFWASGDLNRCQAWLEMAMAVHATRESKRLMRQVDRLISVWG
jgi:tetratricopeptide (TPR) repeat protein